VEAKGDQFDGRDPKNGKLANQSLLNQRGTAQMYFGVELGVETFIN
jgi:hypothetical protein